MRLISSFMAALAAITAMPAFAQETLVGKPVDGKLGFQPAATELARDLQWLDGMINYIIGAIVILVCVLLAIVILRFNRRAHPTPASFTHNTPLEIAWTVVPFLIVVVIGVYATPIVMAQKDTTNADITIKATGYQWKWGYDYLKGEGQGISFLSTLSTPYEQRINQQPKTLNYLSEVDNPVVVPVGKKIRVVTTANDVIHAWMVPAFGVKQDAIPGFVRDTWFKADRIGTFNGHCAELCGKDHAFMPIVVKVVSAEDYTKWVAEQKKKLAANAAPAQLAQAK
ncbi:MAG: cytochrome c oxidase subunit II [Burkholderiaceae bacterium]